MQLLRTALQLSVPCLLSAASLAGTQYRVTVNGEVQSNAIATGFFAGVSPGDAAEISFLVDEDVFVNSLNFPTRGYVIDESSWSFTFPSGSVAIQDPLAGPAFFVIRDNDFGMDGFFIATNVDFWVGLPLDEPGTIGQLENNFTVTYATSLLPSLDVADAQGVFSAAGATSISWKIEDGTAGPLVFVYEKMSVIEVADPVVTPYGCGVNPAGSLSVLSGAPVVGETFELGVDNPLGTQGAGSLPFAIATLGAAPGFPCGLSIPGLGMAGPTAPGELLITVANPSVLFTGSPWAGPGLPASVSASIPFNPQLVGLPVYFQGLLFDPIAASGVDWGLTTAIEAVIGSL